MTQDLFQLYPSLHAAKGMCIIMLIAYYTYSQQLSFVLSKLRTNDEDGITSTAMSHWQPIINVLVYLYMINYHYIVVSQTKQCAEIVKLLFYFSLHLVLPVTMAYFFVRAVHYEYYAEQCYFIQGLLLVRFFYPSSLCPWVITSFESAMFFGALVISIINIVQRLLSVSMRRLIMVIYGCFSIINLGIIIWRTLFAGDAQHATEISQSPIYYFFGYLHAIIWVEYIEEKKRRPKPFIWWQKKSYLNILIVKLVYDCAYVFIYGGAIFMITVCNVLDRYIHSKFLLILFSMIFFPILISANQLMCDFLVNHRTFFCERCYQNKLLIELGQMSYSVLLGYAISSHFMQRTALNIYLGPNNIATMLLYLSGQILVILMCAYLCNITHKYLIDLFDRLLFKQKQMALWIR